MPAADVLERETESLRTRPAKVHREVRIAALGDLHSNPTQEQGIRSVLLDAAGRADVLVLCGDLTSARSARHAVDIGAYLWRTT